MTMRALAAVCLALSLVAPAGVLAQKVVPLWPDGAPGFEDRRDEPEVAEDWWVKNVHNPSLTVYLPPPERATGATVVIAPGGGHGLLVFDGEGRGAARFLNSIGVAAFALKYRLAREEGSPYTLDHVREDAHRAIRLVRSRADEWGVDPTRVGMLGFSAGGEVAAFVAYDSGDGDPQAEDPIDRLNGRPDYQMLVYPGPLGIPDVVPPDAPPAFLLAANDDPCCAETAVDLLVKYRAAGRPVEGHFYARGDHAFNMGERSELVSIRNWSQRLADWMHDSGLLDPDRGASTGITFSWFEYQGKDAVFAEPLAEGTFQNPILAGFYPDPSIARAGDHFYMVHSSFAYSPGVPIFRSTDLVHWQPLGHVLTRPSQLRVAGAGVSRGIFAPTLRHHDGVFYLVTTGIDDAGGNFIVTATDPAGEWSEPIFLPEIDGIDPSLFFDDGRLYLTHNGPPAEEPLYDGHRAIWLWELDPERLQVRPGSGRVIVNGGVDLSQKPIWIEAPHLYRVGGWIYLLCAEGGTGDNHSEVVFRTRDLAEPFVPFAGNPILTQRHLDPARPDPIATAGHADLVETPTGEWWAVFLATRNYDQDDFNTGRETFLLPVSWQGGWPEILPRDTVLPYRLPAPKGLKPTTGAVPLTGNFTWRDDFTSERLDPAWNRLRISEDRWHARHPEGGLTLTPLPASLSGTAQPAFLGRRQQHLTFSAATELTLPATPGVSAGIVAFQGEHFHYFLAARKQGEGHVLALERADGSPPEVIQTHPVPTGTTRLILGIEGDKGRISFSYRLPETPTSPPVPVARDLDARILSTRHAGGFVGTYLGIHARKAEAPGSESPPP